MNTARIAAGRLALALIAAGGLAGCATDKPGATLQAGLAEIERDQLGFPTVLPEAGAFAVFEPRSTGKTVDIDYSVIDEALGLVVLNTGPSTRTRASIKRPPLGSRIVRGHTSAYRLEGNKVFFSLFDDSTTKAFREYADSLIALGDSIDISALPRNDQLAYWFNLHNMILIAEIAENYPVAAPRDLKIGDNGETLHDAKVAEIRGVSLSLRDIRRNIVFRYWNDPRVFYGFFHGDLASPNIRLSAWRGETVVVGLEASAREFINSLRGVREEGGALAVSPLYYEARAGLFPQWPEDLRAHLDEFAGADVESLLASRKRTVTAPYEESTADLVAGDPRSNLNNVRSSLISANGLNPQVTEFLGELFQKTITLRQQGRLVGSVTIIDIDTPDEKPEELE